MLQEKKLQDAVHNFISDPAVVRFTKNGKRLQVLSPGQKNLGAGPDYLDIALLLDGSIVVGDAEFHLKTSYWNLHKHSDDANFNNVVLHIVLDDDTEIQQKDFETLLISYEELETNFSKLANEAQSNSEIDSIEDLQHYALIRLLRKSAEAQKLLNSFSLDKTLEAITNDYLTRYNNRRKRPVYSALDLAQLLLNIKNSNLYGFLNEVKSGLCSPIPDKMVSLIKEKIHNEGQHLRREIILNCVLPIAICLANEEARINLFLWYWSTPALHKYGKLSRKFENLPQNFLWQQQGMLEYIKQHGSKKNIVREVIKEYGFAEVLSFYYSGKSPYYL